MDLKGEYRISAPRETVWAMINDPVMLRECIPGCDNLEGGPAEGFTARVTTKIGPVKATFAGAVRLSNIQAPVSYTISGEGKGGVAGFAKGGADVLLSEDEGETVLAYTANAQVGGKLAQLGSRLVDSTAKKIADEFFRNLAQRISQQDRATEVVVERAAVYSPVDTLPSGAANAVNASPASPVVEAADGRKNAKLWIIATAAVVVVVIAAMVL